MSKRPGLRPKRTGSGKPDAAKNAPAKPPAGKPGARPRKPPFAKARPKRPPEHPPAPARPRYLLFHKPFQVLCQFTPEGGKACLKDFINVSGVYPCGRLDWDSEGLVLLTNDGPLIESFLSPRSKLPKTYWAQVEGRPDEAAIKSLRAGVLIEGKHTLPAGVERFPQGDALPPRSVPIRFRKNVPVSWLRLTLVEGRNRQVRKMTAAVGHPTLRLIRRAIGPFTLEGLEPGQWIELDAREIQLKLSTFSPRP